MRVVESAVLLGTPEEIYERVFLALRPRSEAPRFVVKFRPYANPNSFVRWQAGEIEVRIADMLEAAPAPIQESLAWILLSKLMRREVPALHSRRYRTYLGRKDVVRTMHLLRESRGRKFLSGPEGQHYNLEEVFGELNIRYFNGLMAQPRLSWSRHRARTMLGHFDPSHNAIIISRIFDSADVPRLALEYVMYHEMLHLRYPVEHRNGRRCVHPKEFREAEKQFEQLKEAKELLEHL